MKFSSGLRDVAWSALLVAALGAVCPTAVAAQTVRDDKLGPMVAGRPLLSARAQVVELENHAAPVRSIVANARW